MNFWGLYVAVAAGFASVLGVLVAAYLIGRVWRGGAGAVAAALFMCVASVWSQWEILDRQDVLSWLSWFSFIKLHSVDGFTQRLFDVLRDRLNLPIRWTEVAGPLFNLLAFPGLAVAAAAFGGAVGFVLNRSVPGFDKEIAAPLINRSVYGVYKRLFWTMAAIGIILAIVRTISSNIPAVNDAVRSARYALWTLPALAFGILWFASIRPSERERKSQRASQPIVDAFKPDFAALFESYKADFADHLLRLRPASAPSGSGLSGAAARPARKGAPREAGKIFDRIVAAFAAFPNRLLRSRPASAPSGSGLSGAAARPVRKGAPHEAGPTVDRILAAARKQSIDPGEAWGDDLAAQIDGAWGDRNAASTEAQDAFVLIHGSAPNTLTFLTLAELALCTQDCGMNTLVVSDEGGVGRIGAELMGALKALASKETHRVYNGYGQPSGYCDVVVTSVQRLETGILSNRDASLRDFVLGVGLVVVMDLTQLDAALLRLRFSHLSSLIGGRRPLVFVQSEPRVGLDAQIMSLLAPLGSYVARQLPEFTRDADRRWLMVWRNETAFLESLFKKDLGRDGLLAKPLEIAPFLLVRAWKQRFGAAFYDVAGRVDSRLWNKTLPNLIKVQGAVLNSDEIAGVFTGRLPYPIKDDHVMVIEDLANLAEAVKRATNFRQIDEYLLHILSHDYPLRDFFAARLAAAIDADDHASLDAYLPVAPDPEGGPAELALAVATVVLEERRFDVNEATLLDRIGEFGADGLTADFEGTTREGLAELLHVELGCKPSIVVRRLPGHERSFEFKNIDGLKLNPGYLIALERDTTKDQTEVWLDRGDHGLTYAESTVLQQFGEYYTVDSIAKDKVVAKTAVGLSTPVGDLKKLGQRARNRPRYRFARLYDLEMAAAEVDVIDVYSTASRFAGATVRLLARSGVVRDSVAYLAYPELEAPLARGPRVWESYSHQVSTPRAMRIHARYALPDAVATSGDLPRVALTLAATLQDVLVSMFPRDSERLVVMSPQAEASIVQLLDEADTIERFPCEWLPRLIGLPTASQPVGGLFQIPVGQALFVDSMSKLIKAAEIDRSGKRRLDEPTVRRFSQGSNFLDLVLIEDASHDLGCLRALFEDASWRHVAEVWRDYLAWCVDNAEDNRFYYKFGADRLSKVFHFSGARDFLELASGHPGEAAK